jgi:DNA-binding LacI/PurR family transcriptional regulator
LLQRRQDVAVPAVPPQRPTIYDVARRAGVSKSLVSLVLRNSPQVSEPRRAAVMTAIEELGYRPSRAATVLASRRAHNIEVLIDDYRNPWFVDMVRAMQIVLAQADYRLTVTESQLNMPNSGTSVYASPHVDGRVLAAEPDESLLRGWAATAIPTVVAGWRSRIPPDADLVANDEEAGGRLATAHLVQLGHTAIGHLTGSGGSADHRRVGYLDRMAEAGLRPRIAGVGGGTAEEDGYQAAAALLEAHPDTTAIFAANDTMALGALAVIRQMGRTVPDDMSVIGYDNSALAQSRYLDMTSIDARHDTVGATAARELLARIDDPTRPPTRTLLEPSLIVRATTAGVR